MILRFVHCTTLLFLVPRYMCLFLLEGNKGAPENGVVDNAQITKDRLKALL